jgi:hypothetical protein
MKTVSMDESVRRFVMYHLRMTVGGEFTEQIDLKKPNAVVFPMLHTLLTFGYVSLCTHPDGTCAWLSTSKLAREWDELLFSSGEDSVSVSVTENGKRIRLIVSLWVPGRIRIRLRTRPDASAPVLI